MLMLTSTGSSLLMQASALIHSNAVGKTDNSLLHLDNSHGPFPGNEAQ
jgi:hypothetical protein